MKKVRRIYRPATKEERLRHEKIRSQIAQEFPEIKREQGMSDNQNVPVDLDRIPKMLGIIQRIWLRYPEISFNKLIYNLQFDVRFGKTDLAGRDIAGCDVGDRDIASDSFSWSRANDSGYDIFNLPDEVFWQHLRRIEKKHKSA